MLKALLFDVPLKEILLQKNILVIDLESTTIDLNIIFNGSEIREYKPPKIADISPNSFISIWDEHFFHAELLKTKYQPPLPSHMKITDGCAYLLRIKSKKNLSSLICSCFLTPKQIILDEEIETGEGLFSKNFSFGKEFIHIGTEDEDRLFQRAHAYNPLSTKIEENQNIVESTELGITIKMPFLKMDELIQIQFVIVRGIDPIANWFAVDALPKNILRQAGCTIDIQGK